MFSPSYMFVRESTELTISISKGLFFSLHQTFHYTQSLCKTTLVTSLRKDKAISATAPQS